MSRIKNVWSSISYIYIYIYWGKKFQRSDREYFPHLPLERLFGDKSERQYAHAEPPAPTPHPDKHPRPHTNERSPARVRRSTAAMRKAARVFLAWNALKTKFPKINVHFLLTWFAFEIKFPKKTIPKLGLGYYTGILKRRVLYRYFKKRSNITLARPTERKQRVYIVMTNTRPIQKVRILNGIIFPPPAAGPPWFKELAKKIERQWKNEATNKVDGVSNHDISVHAKSPHSPCFTAKQVVKTWIRLNEKPG